MNETNNQLLINLYVNENNLNTEDQKSIEKALNNNSELKYFYKEKVEQRNYISDLTPRLRPSKKIEKDLLLEIRDINQKVFDFKEDGILKKTLKFLDKPLFTLEL